MRALIKDLHADDKGRAVALVVIDCPADELRRRLASNPTSVELMTRTQIADRSAAVNEPPAASAEPIKGGQLSIWLAQREKEKPFQAFLVTLGCNASTPELAEQAVKSLLRFTSRTQLDNDPDLGVRFRNEIMLEYSAWLNKKHR